MNKEEIDIISAIKILWKKRYVLLTIMIVSLVIGGIYTFICIKPKYKTNTKILIDKADTSIAEFVNSNDIISEMANTLNVQETYINQTTTVTFDKNTKIITISAISTNNDEAFNIVNKYQEILKTKLEEIYENKTYDVIEQPRVASVAYNMNHAKDLVIFLAIGSIICVIYCIFLVVYSSENLYNLIKDNGIILLGKLVKIIYQKKKHT